MFKAVVKIKNQQYIVDEFSKIICDQLDIEAGSTCEFPVIGTLSDFKKTGTAKCEVLKHFLGEKRVVLHKTPRGHDRHRTGSRPRHTLLKVIGFKERN